MTPTAKRLIDKILAEEILWLPHPDNQPQKAAYVSEADVVYYGGAAGGGKALASESRVVTPWGVKCIGDLKVGDTLCNPDGTHQKVIGVYPQGKQLLYSVGFQDDIEVLATGDHRWLYVFGRTKAERQYLHEEDLIDLNETKAGWRIGTTLQLLERFETRSNFRPKVPLTLPVNFTQTTRGIPIWKRLDAYVLGILLGDGSLSGPGVRYTSADLEIVSEIERCTFKEDWSETGNYGYYATGKTRVVLNAILESLGLKGTHSDTKFIPKEYLLAPADVRWRLLQGLLDSDGYVSVNGKVEFTSVSRKLAGSVRSLVHSLGGRASLREKSVNEYWNEDFEEYRDSKQAYNVHIQLPDKSKALLLKRKKDRSSVEFQGGRSPLRRKIEYIEPAYEGEATCIAVDHPNGLFLTEGFVVTHNSDLLLGLAITDHEKSIIFRREYVQLREVIDRSSEILGPTNARYSQTEARWKGIPGGKSLEFGAVQRERDKEKFKGRPHDFIGFDEIPDFTESQFRFLMAWNRTTTVGQRCRVVCAGNPPTTPEGRWVIRYWAPWLRKDHSNPAIPGELRWFVVINGIDKEVDSDEPVLYHGETLTPKSRTFIPSFVTDNPYFDGTEYLSQLQALPEPLRSQLLSGNFFLEDRPQIRQVIPTNWVRKAIARWEDDDTRATSDVTDAGLDPSRGGADQTVLACRTGTYFRPLIVYDGREVPDGNICATRVIEDLGEEFGGLLRVDIIGIGAGVYDILNTTTDYLLADVNFSSKSFATDSTGKLPMRNVRAEAYWTLREALDPIKGDGIALPPDEELVEDLTAPLWTRTPSGILIEDKERIRQRLGRSPGKGDALALAYLDASPGVLFR